MGLYPRIPFEKGAANAVLKDNRTNNKPVEVRRNLPGNVILVHGVNDVGTSYNAVEAGLCEGLSHRLNRSFLAATYRQPSAADKDARLDDPDAVFYKRKITTDTDSPVIPFYWGFRELDNRCKNKRGQITDYYGNRLDKDSSKGGGPFANATSSLPDMWNKGFGTLADLGGDPIRPLLDAPGRMYMVLAALRLAALISMIRDYDKDETVTVIAHSQGCLLTLLAQAMLAEKNLSPADTLILTHPPYSLVDEAKREVTSIAHGLHGGIDEVMKPYYSTIAGVQSLHGRLQTLINIVNRVAANKTSATEPQFSKLTDHQSNDGVVGRLWKAESDRDNRGKVYLYFCPQDMTVALDNMQGIGWQGVPDLIEGTQITMVPEMIAYRGHRERFPTGRMVPQRRKTLCSALETLGKGFYQRVFTSKQRPHPTTGKLEPVLVGWPPPYDYVLRRKGEDDQAHVEDSGRTLRDHFPEATWPINPRATPAEQRNGIRKITGEALPVAVPPVLSSAAETAPRDIPKGSSHAKLKMEDRGPCEDVDPIDAQIAVSSNSGMLTWQENRLDPRTKGDTAKSPSELQDLNFTVDELKQMTADYNREKGREGGDQRTVISAGYIGNSFIIAIEESPNEAQLRWQHELSAKSFHGAIIGNRENHKQVTAYDVAIGKGTAVTHPKFYAYLCAVADWRLKKPLTNKKNRPEILLWEKFLSDNSPYWNVEPDWRKALIEGNSVYYSSGVLPAGLPLPAGGLWRTVIADTVDGTSVNPDSRHGT